jgi:hypothetical protein
MFQIVGLLVAWQIGGYFFGPVYAFASAVLLGN